MPPAKQTPLDVGGRTLSVSNLDKVLYPATGFTKGEMISYYVRIAEVLLPHAAGRPLTLRRYPDGVEASSFFAKNAPSHTPDWIRTVTVPTSSHGSRGRSAKNEQVDFVLLDDLPGLVYLANLAAIELHVPLWHLGRTGEIPADPDHMVFDLDPGDGTTVVECCRVASLIAAILAEHGREAYPKTSGSKGLQLYVPYKRRPTWDQIRDASYEIATKLERDHPGLVVSNMKKELRRGKVFIDWSQNHPVKTTVLVYSLRARPEQTVSTPVTWAEVEECARKGDPELLKFTADDVIRRVEENGDMFSALAKG